MSEEMNAIRKVIINLVSRAHLIKHSLIVLQPCKDYILMITSGESSDERNCVKFQVFPSDDTYDSILSELTAMALSKWSDIGDSRTVYIRVPWVYPELEEVSHGKEFFVHVTFSRMCGSNKWMTIMTFGEPTPIVG